MLFKNYDQLIRNGATSGLQQKRKDLLDMLTAAVDAVQPYRVVSEVLHGSRLVFPSETFELASFDRLFLIGFGKASVGMAQAVCDAVSIQRGVIITNDPSSKAIFHSIEVIIGGHPLPNKDSIRGTKKILHLLNQCRENDCVIVLISGGGSSLLCNPRIPLSDLKKTIKLLLQSGATIDEINTIRKHLSFVKGGQLVLQTKAVVVSLIISDVVRDQISSIASGPTSPDLTTFSDVKEILCGYHLWEKISKTARNAIEDGVQGRVPETLKKGNPAFDKVFNFIIANNELACQAAIKKAEELGYKSKLLTTSITGEAKIIGKSMIKKTLKYLSRGNTAFIMGGEPTVKVHGTGIGGRNQEFVLGCVEEIAGMEIVVASLATDGIDGNSDAAGAVADGFTFDRAKKNLLIPHYFIKENNSYTFFETLGDTIHTGLTGTNVMDIQIVLR